MRKFTVEISKATNCICNICHRDGRVAKIKYYTQDYGSNKRKRERKAIAYGKAVKGL